MSRKIKCLVWDLDNTVWEGTLLEDDRIALRPRIKEVFEELDRRGILLSIASRNDHDDAMLVLKSFGLDEFFLYPQIHWGAKSESVKSIAVSLNIGIDSIAFIDDNPSEREEVRFSCPDVMVLDEFQYEKLLDMPEFQPRFVTDDARHRREMYLAESVRKQSEIEFKGSNDEFLKTLDMRLTISPVGDGDLERVEELTQRTNQLNSTGITYDYDELKAFMSSDRHVFFIAGLDDKFGSYGKIGLALAEETADTLDIKLLLMSCRVATRGIGTAMLIHLIRLASEKGKRLTADFKETGRNRMMGITYKLIGFYEDGDEADGVQKLVYKGPPREYPDYIAITLS